MDVQSEIQRDTKEKENVGVFVETEETTYFVDESPEYNNKPGNRFTMGELQQDRREFHGWPYVDPHYYRETVTVMVTRVEISREEYRAEHPLNPRS